MCTRGDTAHIDTIFKFLPHTRPSFINSSKIINSLKLCYPKPPLHSHNWLSFGKFQDTERFLIHCERHVSSRLPSSDGTWKYARPLVQKKTWRDSLPIDMLFSAVSILVIAQSSSEIPEGLMNNPVYPINTNVITSTHYQHKYLTNTHLQRTSICTSMYRQYEYSSLVRTFSTIISLVHVLKS